MINNTSYLAKSNYYFIRVLKDYVETVVLLSRKDVYERIKFDVNVEGLQKDVAHLTGEKHALTTEIKSLSKATEEEKIRYLNLKAASEKLSGEIARKRRELTVYVFSDRNSVLEVPRGTLHLGEADDILDL